MAYNNSNSKTYYSKVSFNNQDNSEYPNILRFEYWGGLLKVKISLVKRFDNDKIRYEDTVNIHLSHIKARIFANEIRKLLAGEVTSAGVDTPKGVIFITEEFGEYKLSILKTDNSDYQENHYVFRNNWHYGIENVKDANDFTD